MKTIKKIVKKKSFFLFFFFLVLFSFVLGWGLRAVEMTYVHVFFSFLVRQDVFGCMKMI